MCLSNGRHLCKATETRSGCNVNGGAAHRNTGTLDADWLIIGTSGKTALRSPWDEDNGSTDNCSTAPWVGVISVYHMASALVVTMYMEIHTLINYVTDF